MTNGVAKPRQHKCPITGGQYGHRSFSHIVHLYLHATEKFEDRILRLLFSSLPDLFRWFGGLISEFSAHSGVELTNQPFTSTLTRYERKWLKVGVNLLNGGFPNEAGELLQRWYVFVRENEILYNTRFVKGTTLWWLGRSRQALRDDDEARNWFLLAMLEDIRTDPNTWQTLPAYDFLVNAVRVSANVASNIGRDATTFCNSRPYSTGEPETLWLYLLPHKRRITRAPLAFIKGLSNDLHIKISAQGITAKQAGDALEQLILYLFATEKGFEVLGPSQAPDAQNDVIIRNNHLDRSMISIGDYLLVECKNWNKKVKSPVIREFSARLQTTSVKTGILVARSGISGGGQRRQRTGARLAISKEYLHDKTAVIVLDNTLISDVIRGDISLPTALLSIFEDVRFDRV